MEDLNDKVTGGTLTASEWNQVPSEIQNVIEESGITLSNGDVAQQLQSIYNIVRRALLFVDSGIADAYVLTSAQSQAATEYRDGMTIIFFVENNNTGASTINIDGLGVQTITDGYNTLGALVGGEITGLITLIYDGTNFSVYQGGSNSVYDNNTSVEFRNNADNADIGLLSLDTSDQALVGNSVNDMFIDGTNITFRMGITNVVTMVLDQVNDDVSLYYGGNVALQTTDVSSLSRTTSLAVYDVDGSAHDVGYNVMPVDIKASAITLTRNLSGKQNHYLGNDPVSYTIGTDTDIPIGTTWMIFNRSPLSSDITIVVGGNSIQWMDGSTITNTGDRTLGFGGIATLTKIGSLSYILYGSGIS